MKVKEIMKPVRTIDHLTSAKKAADLMKKVQISSIVVTNSKKAKGIVTERDFLTKISAENKVPSRVIINEIMSKSLITIDPDSVIDDAIYLMLKHKIKKLPVVRDQELLGIITATDIVKNSSETGEFFFFD